VWWILDTIQAGHVQKKWAEAGNTCNMNYQCGINFFWQNCVVSPLPGAPMYKPRI
jgi:hypothetical protein